MTDARQKRLLRELILEGKVTDNSKAPKKEPEKLPQNKLHLNIRRLLNMLKRVKDSMFPSSKGTGQNTVPISKGDPETTRSLNDIWGLTKFVVGYGIIGGFVLSLALMLLPLQIPLAVWIKGSVIANIIVSILGMGSLAYIYYDMNLFVLELRNRGK